MSRWAGAGGAPSGGRTIEPHVNGGAHDDALIFAAVESLYADELRPYSRILRKRLCERAEANDNYPNALAADIVRLRARCESCRFLRIEEEQGGEWSVVIFGRPPCFIDIYSSQDPYSVDFWDAAKSYFQGIPDCDAILPGGRYACASALAARSLPFLDGLSLGCVCHVVQLALSHTKLLGYLSGAVVPYALSQSMVKDCCASQRAPVVVSNDSGVDAALPAEAVGQWPVATWAEVANFLREIIRRAPSSGEAFVPLSNVKKLFRTECNMELSETALGYSKLSELLQDARMKDICQLKLQPFGYIVLPPSPPFAVQPLVHERPPQTCTMNHAMDSGPSPYWSTQFFFDGPYAFGAECMMSHWPGALEMSAVLPATSEVGSSLDKLWASAAIPVGNPHLLCLDEALLIEQDDMTLPDPEMLIASGLSALSPHTLSKEGSVGRHVRNTFIHFGSSLTTSFSGSARRSRSMPKDVGSRKCDWESACNSLSYLYCTAEPKGDCCTETGERITDCDTDEPASLESTASDEEGSEGSDDSLCRRAFCSNEPLWFEEDECSLPAHVMRS